MERRLKVSQETRDALLDAVRACAEEGAELEDVVAEVTEDFEYVCMDSD